MKIKALSHLASEHTRERIGDLHPVRTNCDPLLHPHEKEREYVRAVQAAKLQRLHAKPFLGALQGHADGVYCLSRHPTMLSAAISGSGDGEIRLWDLSSQRCLSVKPKAHKAFVRGVCCVPEQGRYLSCSDDMTIKLWSAENATPINEHDDELDAGDVAAVAESGIATHRLRTTVLHPTHLLDEPVKVWTAPHALLSIDHHRRQTLFAASGGNNVLLYDHARLQPLQSYTWGSDTVTHCRFNPIESAILASCSVDRSLVLYDTRMHSALHKTTFTLRANAIAWHPTEAYTFSVANEDHAVYTFDMRKMERACHTYRDHVSAVMDCAYDPTGCTLATAGYDRTIRLYNARSLTAVNANAQHSTRDVYHTSRMQRLFCVQFSGCSRYLLSGSDDGNVRLWRTHASQRSGPQAPRQRQALAYREALIRRHASVPEVSKLLRPNHIPKVVRSAAVLKRTVLAAQDKRVSRERQHSAPGSVPFKSIRKSTVLAHES